MENKRSWKENMAYVEQECMGEAPSACVATCPMHCDVKGYMKLAREGKGKEAIALVRESLFLPSVLGRVCAAPCEGKCKYQEVGQPLSIAGVKRYLADHFDEPQNWDTQCAPLMGKKVAVVGAGPAGLQVAVDLRKRGVQVEVLEKLPLRGGMMAVGIPHYRLPPSALERDLAYLDALGIVFRYQCSLGEEVSLGQLQQDYDAVVLAMGKHAGILPIDKEENVVTAPDFLRQVALEGAYPKLGERVLVIGGGDVAMDCCRVARRLAQQVYSASLEDSFQSMTSSPHEVEGAREEGVQFHHGRGLGGLQKTGEGLQVSLKKCTAILDEEGKFAPVYQEDDCLHLTVDTVIFAIGQRVLYDKGDISQEKNGELSCQKDTLLSPQKGVFVCGDASGTSRTLIEAMASGRRAADSVMLYLEQKSLTKGRDFSHYGSYPSKLEVPLSWEEVQKRKPMPERPGESRVEDFREVALGYTEVLWQEECQRCLQCQCRLCMKECLFLPEYCASPKALFQEYREKGYKNMDAMIAFSCNDCSQCRLHCPKNLDLQHSFIGAKAQYIEDNGGKQVMELLKPYDEIQERECSPAYSITVTPWKKKKFLFVPGCTVPAYSGELIEKSYAHLRENLEQVGAMLQCCGKVTLLNGEVSAFQRRNAMAVEEIQESEADVIITICPSCYCVYRDTTDKQVLSYWDLMRKKIGIPPGQKGIGKESDVVFQIHDPCVTRDVSSHHESIRWILDELGYEYEEISRSRGDTRCCGVGGMVCSSNPNLFRRIYQRRAEDFTRDQVVTYCGSCRGTMETAGKDSLHILNLLFGTCYRREMKASRSYQDGDEMWKNRFDSRQRLEDASW